AAGGCGWRWSAATSSVNRPGTASAPLRRSGCRATWAGSRGPASRSSRSWERVATTEVLVTQSDGVGRIVLNRPEAMNAITVALGRELERAVRRLGDEARVIVIRGAGGNFCVGGDFHELERLRDAGEGALAELFDSFRAACA